MAREFTLFVRISASDWADGGWDIEESVQLAKVLKEKGVDLIDVLLVEEYHTNRLR
jgi:2,4-dienoyl-CoA reductase-like NADH-dependent reductase (Old Yellow Enzyme family)